MGLEVKATSILFCIEDDRELDLMAYSFRALFLLASFHLPREKKKEIVIVLFL